MFIYHKIFFKIFVGAVFQIRIDLFNFLSIEKY